MLSRVLLVTNEYPPEKTAGTAMSTHFLAEELAARGYQVAVVVNTRHTAPPRESNDGLHIFRLRPRQLPWTRMGQRAAFLMQTARRFRPEIIQGQSLSCGFLALLAGRVLGIPTVTYVQGYDLYESTMWARQTYIRWALSFADRVVTVTDDLRTKAVTLSAGSPEVIPHGLRQREAHALDQDAARSLLGLPAGTIILFVGRLIHAKGVIHLIRIMPKVLAARRDVRLVILGEGPERAALTALVNDLNLSSIVSFVGERPHEDAIAFMRASDLFVLPSLTEPFGMVLVEAMSCGLPIVASNVMGIPSIVEEGTNGFLVPPGNEGALAAQVLRLLADPVERGAMGLRNIHKASDYALPKIADRFVQLWENAVVSRGGSAGARSKIMADRPGAP